MSKQDKATNDRHSRILRELVKQPDNKVCADCKRHDPRWASWNIGVFVCIRCSGVHRSMGTHISKVKSVDLDVWTPDQIQSVQKWGNRRANLYWEAHLKAGHVPPDHKVDSFIRSKYDGRRWAMDGPPPDDPSILDGSPSEEALPPQEVITGQPLPSSTPPPKPSSPVPGLNPGSSRPAHALLSTTIANANANQAAQPRRAAAPAAPVAPPKPQDDLFSLDFHAAPAGLTSSGSGVEQKKGTTNDIMSLFSAGPAVAAPAPATNAWGGAGAWAAPAAAAPATGPSSDLWGSFTSAQAPAQNSSLFGGLASAQPQSQMPLSNVWGAPAAVVPAASSFGANVWGSSAATSTGPELFGSLASSGGNTQRLATTKKDDAFGDLWS